METQPRKPYPTGVTDKEWAFVEPYLMLMAPSGPQRRHGLREVLDALGWIARRRPVADAADQLPALAGGLPQAQRWIAAARPATTNGCPKRSPACISRPSPA